MDGVRVALGEHFLDVVKQELYRLKVQAERAVAQVRDDRALHHRLDAESNSIAIIMRHLSGNMVSRWTDFLTTDGEKLGRNRDAEFEPPESLPRAELLSAWEEGWDCLFKTLDSLASVNLQDTVRIRGEGFSVVEAILRQLPHYASHVGQIVFLAKHLEWERWQSLSIPRGQSSGPWPYKGNTFKG
jgi:hypothetical protein